MASLNPISAKRKLGMLVHSLGLSSLGGALLLQSLVFSSILQNEYLKGIEQNQFILNSEIVITGVGITYFGYMFIRFVFSNK